MHIRSIKAFEKSCHVEDWNELMKLFLVRRTRSFIKQYFAKTDVENGRRYLEFPDKSRSYFPDRVPCAVKFTTEPGDQYSRLYSEEMIALMEELQLPRYGLSRYISEAKAEAAKPHEKQLIENLSRAGQRMMGFCKSTFFKRIDSSGFAFLLTLYRHILRNCVFLYAIDNKLPLPIGDENALPEDSPEDEDTTATLFNHPSAPSVPGGSVAGLPEGVITYARTANDFDILTWLDREGNFITQSQKKILSALECPYNEPALPPLEEHHALVGKAVELMHTQSKTVSGGILGNRFSTRYRIIALLEHYYEQPATLFFSEENREQLKLAIDDIYNYPLLEQTKFMPGRMLRASSRTASDDIVEYVLEMRRTGSLCRIDEETATQKENTIICSMGIKMP